MDAAIYVQGSTNLIAKGVERCKCPKRFDGLSCQDPGHSYYRWRNTSDVESVFIEDLIGRAAPCHCNGRSNDCDRETGVCLVSFFTRLLKSASSNCFDDLYLKFNRELVSSSYSVELVRLKFNMFNY